MAPTALQFQQKKLLDCHKEKHRQIFFCIFPQIIHSAVCFQLPRNCQRCFRKRHCQNLVPLVMNTGWQQGVNHGKDNALLEQAWFDSSRRMTLLDYYHVSSAALSCSFCSVSGALRGFSQWIPIDFFWSCHQIVCGLNRDYHFLICSLRFFSPINFLSYLVGGKLHKRQAEWTPGWNWEMEVNIMSRPAV